MALLSKFLCLLRKNYVLYWRSWIQAIFVICIPLLLVCVLVGLRSVSPRQLVNQTSTWSDFSPNFVPNSVSDGKPLILFSPNDSRYANVIMQNVSTYLNVSLVGFKNEKDVLEIFRRNIPTYDKALGAVIFPASFNENNTNYTIRLRSTESWLTNSLFLTLPKVGPRTSDAYASPPNYHKSGFLGIQNAIDRSIVSLSCSKEANLPVEFNSNLKRMPYPAYIGDNFVVIIQKQLDLVFILGFSLPTLYASRLILTEKSQRMKVSCAISFLDTFRNY